MEKIIQDAAVENIETATRFVEGELQKYNSLNIGQIAVAIDELFGNIAKYAYKDGAGKVEVQVEVTGEPPVAAVTFIDSGIPYNPLKKADPDITLSAKERSIGGLGIYIVKKTMDEIWYDYRDGKNVVTIRKKL